MFNKLSYDSQLICETALLFIWKNIYQVHITKISENGTANFFIQIVL